MSGLFLFSSLKRSIGAIIILLFTALNLCGQNVIGVIDYMKVEDPAEYLEVEALWQKIHEERLKDNMIIGWSVYQVMFKTEEDPYNFITISWYDAFSKLDKGVPQSVLKAAFPDFSSEEWNKFNDRTNKSRKLISSSVFHQRLTCADKLDKLGKFYVINEISVKQGRSHEYIDIYNEIYKPLYEEDIRNKKRTNWSLWEKWPGNMKDFQYLSSDGYDNLDQIDHSNFLEYFAKIHPGEDFNAISNKVEEIRTLVNTEMWKLIYRAVK